MFLKKRTKYIIIKDHFQYSFFSNLCLRFMDFFGNFYNGIKVPKKYYTKKEFDDLIMKLNFNIINKVLNKRYHSKKFLFLSNMKYHFIYLIK
jgi:hypothetical protein